MPGGDRTGPNGLGPMTGRRAGYCTGYNAPGFANLAGFGRGFGFGGGGRGWRNMYYATGLAGWQRGGFVPLAPQKEAESLKAQADWLKGQIDAINRRIDELEQK